MNRLDNFIAYADNYESLRERQQTLLEHNRIIKAARKGNWRPTVKLSEFYRDIAPVISNKDWPAVREAIVEMIIIEKQLFSPTFALRESNTQNKLLERYAKLILFSDQLQEDDRVRDFIHAANQRYGANFMAQFDKADPLNDDLSHDEELQALNSIYMRAKEEDDYEIAGTAEEMRNDLDIEREVGQENLKELPDPEDIANADPKNLQNIALDVAEELSVKVETGDISPQEATKEIADTVKKAGKKGGIFKKFLQRLGGIVAKIVKPIAYVVGGAKFMMTLMPVFAPLGPFAPVAGIIVGVIITHITLKLGALGGRVGVNVSGKLYQWAAEGLSRSKIPIVKKIGNKILNSAKGKKVVQTICGIIGSVVAGGGFAIGAHALASRLASAVAAQGAVVVAEMTEVSAEIAPEIIEEAEVAIEVVSEEAATVIEAQPAPQQAAPIQQQQNYQMVNASTSQYPPSALDGKMADMGWTRGECLDGNNVWFQRTQNGDMRMFVDVGNNGQIGAGDIMYTKTADGQMVTEVINNQGNFVETARTTAQQAANATVNVQQNIQSLNNALQSNMANYANNPAVSMTAGGRYMLSADTLEKTNGLRQILADHGLQNARISNAGGPLRITFQGDPQQYTIFGNQIVPAPSQVAQAGAQATGAI